MSTNEPMSLIINNTALYDRQRKYTEQDDEEGEEKGGMVET